MTETSKGPANSNDCADTEHGRREPDSDPAPANAGSASTAADTGSAAAGIASIERVFLRLTFWQTLLSLAGVFTGAVALYAALSESQAVRQQTAAAVWPYAELSISDYVREDDASISIEIKNAGVGPAKLRGMELVTGNTAHRNWRSVLDYLLGADAAAGVDFGRSSVGGRVLAPGEALLLFRTADKPTVLAMQALVYQSGASRLSYCYCSIFDNCWLVTLAATVNPEPQSVAQCPDYGEREFGQFGG